MNRNHMSFEILFLLEFKVLTAISFVHETDDDDLFFISKKLLILNVTHVINNPRELLAQVSSDTIS